ncbi:MAG: hypothetical protein ABFD82_05380 [Syntrophaceae bacterium]
MTIYLFSLAILLNSFSMTALMLVCGLAGAPGLTADIAVVQGATLALFYAFSANTRNVIFADPSGSATHLMLRTRFFLIVPLAILSFILSSVIGSVDTALALVLILRRSSEWIGEVFLSSCEVRDVRRPAIFAVTVECLGFVLSIVLIFLAGVGPASAMIIWAVAPLAAVISNRLPKSAVPLDFIYSLGKLAPNLGSTAIIGMTVYVFRLSIILLIGRVAAGDLFTAFAIGGLIPTVYNSSIGPSLALRDHRDGTRRMALKLLSRLVPGLFLFGAAITAVALYYPNLANLLNKSHYFWTSVGLSFSGGAIMIIALHRRITMLQGSMNVEIFGSDVLSNILIVVVIPYFYYLLGARSLEGLYLYSAVVNLCFYWSAQRMNGGVEISKPFEKAKLFIIGGLVFLPVFFQLGGSILFKDSAFVFDTGRLLRQLPIPVSVIALFAGILLLGRFRDAHRSLTVFFFTALTLVLASLTVREVDHEIARLVLMAQYLLPVLGLVLGEMYGAAAGDDEFEKACLVVMCFIVPVQLLCSWAQGLLILTPYLYIFSIYQHLHYVSVMTVVIFGMVFICIWGRQGPWKTALAILLPLMAIYAGASYSVEVLIILFGMIAVALWVPKPPLVFRRVSGFLLALMVFVGIWYGVMNRIPAENKIPKAFSNILEVSQEKNKLASEASSPHNLGERFKRWKFHITGSVSGFKEFFFGHPTRPDRTVHPSAYNYYLDVLYNFGFLALLPLLLLLVYTAWGIYLCRTALRVDRLLLAAALGTFVVFIVDNSLKVGLRQPYPGILGFFLLGLLQARISRSHVRGANVVESNLPDGRGTAD